MATHYILIITMTITGAVVGALVTFVVTTLHTRSIQKAIAREITDNHEAIHHKIPVIKQIKEHNNTCPAANDHKAVRTALIFLVSKAGGDLQDLGLS